MSEEKQISYIKELCIAVLYYFLYKNDISADILIYNWTYVLKEYKTKYKLPNIWDKRIGNCVKNTGTDRFEFQKAILLNDENTTCPNIIFECEEKYLFDVLPNSGSLLVVSRKVLDILKRFCPEDFQVFEANVYAKDKKINGYYLLNLLVSLNVIDKENSAFKRMKNSNAILKFDK